MPIMERAEKKRAGRKAEQKKRELERFLQHTPEVERAFIRIFDEKPEKVYGRTVVHEGLVFRADRDSSYKKWHFLLRLRCPACQQMVWSRPVRGVNGVADLFNPKWTPHICPTRT